MQNVLTAKIDGRKMEDNFEIIDAILENRGIEDVASFLINNLGYQKKDLVLFGYSYGAEPTIHLISSSKYNGIAGVVLLSPYIVKISKSNHQTTLNENIFLKCPFFVIHGKKDNIVPYTTSTRLIEKIRNVYAWYPKSEEPFLPRVSWEERILQLYTSILSASI
jgi:predicted esterase